MEFFPIYRRGRARELYRATSPLTPEVTLPVCRNPNQVCVQHRKYENT